MGQTGSRLSRLASSFSFSGMSQDEEEPDGAIIPKNNFARFGGKLPLVYLRRGSMYFDEDGDLAHEFWEEVPTKKAGVRRMRKVSSKRLTPQGEVEYQHPRLNVDFPIVMFED